MKRRFNESVRSYDHADMETLEAFIEDFGLEDTNENRIKCLEIIEYRRRTDFMVDNGDRWDEQIEGISDLLVDIARKNRKSFL